MGIKQMGADHITHIPKEYPTLLNEIKQRIRSAQYEALKSVNKELISLYWDIGRMIVERQKGKTWGKSVVERLAKDLQDEFTGIGEFCASNLWRMKVFYQVYSKSPKLAPLVRELLVFLSSRKIFVNEFPGSYYSNPPKT